MKFGTAEDRDNYLIRFCVAELVDVIADQTDRTDWTLHHVQVGPRGEDAVASLLVRDGINKSLIRVDVQLRGYWVAGLGRPSDPAALPLRWATDPPRVDITGPGLRLCGNMLGVNATFLCIRQPTHLGDHRCGDRTWPNMEAPRED